jgi:hypothetical protein
LFAKPRRDSTDASTEKEPGERGGTGMETCTIETFNDRPLLTISTTVYVDHMPFDVSSDLQIKADHTANEMVHEVRSTQHDHGRK